ncbi:Uncharacterised protein [Mycobacteroides abscessus subsp. abscessus]|nr:Uncharacterised protein [Mycobacteroides abscessus subsp. abscessus]
MSNPTSAIVTAATRIAPGQRTVAAPTRRQPRAFPAPLGSSTLPKRLATEINAGPRVSAIATTIAMPIDNGIPVVLK